MAVLGTYIPSGQFAFTRSQVAGIRFGYDAGSLSVDYGGGLYGALDPSGTVAVFVQVNSFVFAASTNHYTLDHVIEFSIYRTPPTSPINHDLRFYLSYTTDDTTGYPWLEFSPTNPPGLLKFGYRWPAVSSPWYHPPWS